MDTAVRFFKAMADESRLRIVGLLAHQERSVEELATELALTPPTVSHHLNRLKEIGLVRMEARGTTHLYRLEPEVLTRLKREVLSPERIAALTAADAPPGAAEGEGDVWAQKVLRDFLDGERLREIPAQRKKRAVILRWLVERFEPERRYPERELNETIKRHHEDAATLRRELIGAGLMQREGGVYWRVPDNDAAAARSGRRWEY
jgi:hypothetical protein